ncbi:pre-mRNA-splicing factor cwc22-like [Primulina eburnea]|uniref:pre-mRNA-splicing factor cwc22-like n=1 Tax=Primulina eburnea TaxID=1245227 RepID=UPI003C6C3137
MGKVRRSDSSRREDEKQESRGRHREISGEKTHLAEYDGKDHNRMWRKCTTKGRETLRDEDGDVRMERKKKNMDERMEESRIMTKNEGDTSPSEADKVGKPDENAGRDIAANSGRSGGVYITPHMLATTMKDIQVKSTIEYQRMTWDEMRKSMTFSLNRVAATNIKIIIPELFAVNLIRGKGLFCRSCMECQILWLPSTDAIAGLVAVVNAKFPEVGDLLLRRIVFQLQRAFKLNDKPQLLASVKLFAHLVNQRELVAPVKFIAHLVNQRVAHELIAFEVVTLLLEKPIYENVKVAVGFLTECGSALQDLSPLQFHDIFERLRGIHHGGTILVQLSIEHLFELREAKFQGCPAIRPELDLVEPKDQVTHKVSLQDEIDPEIALDTFYPDAQLAENKKLYDEFNKKCSVTG